MNTKIWKRVLAGILAGVLIFTGIPFSAAAEESQVQMIIRGDAFQNRPINIFGHSHRSITCYYVNPVEGHVPAFCLQPGKKLPNHTKATWQRYSASPDTSIPVIGSFDRYLPMMMAYEWVVSGNYYDKTRYAVVQTYFWGCLAGCELDWDAQEATMRKLEWAIGDGRVMSLFGEMRSAVETGLAEYEANGGSSLPVWNGQKQNMTLKDGHYELTLDMGNCPQLKTASWQLPDTRWSYKQGPGENEITFIFQGEEPSGRISAGEIEGINERYYAYLFNPGENFQMQMGWLDMQKPKAEVWFETGKGGSAAGGQTETLERFRHKEVFEADYKVGLEKYCAETGQPLSGAAFQVWESFDHSQINENGYIEGEPDGATGEVYANCMSPEPEESWLCDEIITDEEGKAFHSDIRSYNYSKTYCLGHPAPEWIECDHDGGGDGENGEGEEEECNCEEENERLREQWMREQELCEASTDFHVPNDDEEKHGQSTLAMEAMLEDRDETYENFIALEYGYTLTEKNARNGYIVHGKHKDDQEIEKITTASAQAHGEQKGERSGAKTEETGLLSGAASLTFNGQPDKIEEKACYSYETGELGERTLEDLRRIREIKWEEDIYEDEDDWDDEEEEEIWATDSNVATRSGAEKNPEVTEQYIYIREDAEVLEASDVGESVPWYIRLFQAGIQAGKSLFRSEEDEDDDSGVVTGYLPDFIDDDLGEMDTSGYGDGQTCLYSFRVWDHRTEGSIYINKRDLQLYDRDADASYGKTQGDGTLEGAVYGLFAAADIIHPDGKSGVIYKKDELTAIATTDAEGNAAFLAYTEVPHTIVGADGNIQAPTAYRGAENLYTGSTITSSKWGFGSYTYPDRKGENGCSWIGRPLIMGSYYIQELSRSEGYELSVTGKKQVETNRGTDKEAVVKKAGQVRITAGLSDHGSMEADGSWNDFTVESFGTENGYEITVSGYPEHTDFYKVIPEERRETVKQVTEMKTVVKTDLFGDPVYKRAKGGELKTDENGEPVLKEDPKEEEKIPAAETVPYRFRTAPYIKGEAQPEDISLWDEAIEADYLKEQAQDMLKQLGYKEAKEGAPWAWIPLRGANGEAVQDILDWYTLHGFYDQASVCEIKKKEGAWYAGILYDHSGNVSSGNALYDRADGCLYIKKKREQGHYWVAVLKGGFRLGSHTAYVKEKREYAEDLPEKVTDGLPEKSLEDEIKTVYQPVYERYEAGELLLDASGAPILETEQVPVYEEREAVYMTARQEPVKAVWDAKTQKYTIKIENETDWTSCTEAVEETFRAVTKEQTIFVNGEKVPYNQYLTVMGAAVDVKARFEKEDEGSYIQRVHLAYPGQNQTSQDMGTEKEPVIVLERVIRQPVRVTKHISQSSYENVNTYGAVHNDPVTSFLGLFKSGGKPEGAKLISRFSFRIYLKQNLLNLYVDDQGNILSEDISLPEYGDLAQLIFLPPKDGKGHRLLEEKEDGKFDYRKFFDALEAAQKKRKGSYPKEVLTQFALDHYNIKAYKEEILKNWPYKDSDRAYEEALDQAREEASVYLDQFSGLKDKLSIAWERDIKGGVDGDRKTLQCNTKNGKENYSEYSLPLPYGEYVIEEQMPSKLSKELANRHYRIEEPKEISLPFVPEIVKDGQIGEETVFDEIGSMYFRYCSSDSPEDLIRKYKIRFNEESRKITADSEKGTFELYPYGLDRDIKPGYYRGYLSRSEDGAVLDGIFYDGNETDSGQVEIRDQVPAMKGQNTAIEGKFAPMLVPWSILGPEYDRINPDTGDLETLRPSGSRADFNYVAFAGEDFENTYYSCRLRIEKTDSETGENLIHEGALFRIYAAKREADKAGTGNVSGSGQVLFGPAVDHEGNKVTDADGKEILYPRVGQDNGSTEDLPVKLDEDEIPLYDESQRISQINERGARQGIFRSFTTLKEVLIDGKLEKMPVGYIETPKPLGAGAYVLVEVQAPEGYRKSRPVAFEIYGDAVSYYREMPNRDGTWDGWEKKEAARYQYAIPVTGDGNKYETETVSQIPVENHPSKMRIRKVEDGDKLVGNENRLEKKDKQGLEEPGGFDGPVHVNDKGDELLYQVWGRKEKLEERGDVRDIHFDTEKGMWTGKVTKKMDTCSEEIIEGTEKELKAIEGVKPLYDMEGNFTGKGIRFHVTISEATLALYEGICLEKGENGGYKGVTVEKSEGKTEKITAFNTGTRREILSAGKDTGPAGLTIWQDEKVEKEPVNLYFYDLDQLRQEKRLVKDDDNKRACKVLDDRGNFICYADEDTGMAFVYDDYGRIIAYAADDAGNKKPVHSFMVKQDEKGDHIYTDKNSVDDENGLSVYDKNGHLTFKEEIWTSDHSQNSRGEEERKGGVHEIDRLPFGAYILQEEQVPFEQGYVQAPYQGIFFEDSIEPQEYFHSNAFTRAAFAKIDVQAQKEIKGAKMTLYESLLGDNGEPLTDEAGIYLPGKEYASWLSGYACDDKGNLKKDEEGKMIETDEPHWLDHIPVGFYVLEESLCPYDQGYVQSKRENIQILETEHVQSFEMEDDFTAVEIRKEDGKTGELLYEDSPAVLTLYQVPEGEEEKDLSELLKEENKLLDFDRAGYKEWQEMWATGREEPDAAGLNPITKYDYFWQPVPGTFQGRFCCTEEGNIRFEYLPKGFYILTESSTPEGYATADPLLFEITDKGHFEMIHHVKMTDEPLRLNVSKNHITGGKEVAGAQLAIYPVNEDGSIAEEVLVLHIPDKDGQYREEKAQWISGMDGVYTKEEQDADKIPAGFKLGDLKPHFIEYIPAGDYVLREEMTPYGFLQSVDIFFTIEDTKELQKQQMQDEIPQGQLEVIKHDADDQEKLLQGAEFELLNETLGVSCEKAVTDEKGKAVFSPQPIGYLGQRGQFEPYDYLVREIRPAAGYMLSEKDFPFQFEYKDEKTPLIHVTYDPVNDSNRVLTKKLISDTEEFLEGAVLKLELAHLKPTDPGEGTGESYETVWEEIETWTTGKQPHLIKGLKAGEYRLIEIQAPNGYTLAEKPVYFTITDGMTEVPEVLLRNYGTICEVEKREEHSENPLSGARMELVRKDTMEIVRQWTSRDDQSETFYGLEPGIYLLREVQAPEGYEKGSELEIEVQENRQTPQEFIFYNTRIRSSGGGGNHTVPKKSYISFKKTDEEKNPLSGAVFAFYNQMGQVMEIAESGENGYFKISTPPDGTYVFREITAPEGYEVSSQIYHFTVENGKLVKGIFEIENEKIQEKKTGWIQAFYERKSRYAGFNLSYNSSSGYSLKTGDESMIVEALAATFLCVLAAGWCLLRDINGIEKRKRYFWFACILLGTIFLVSFSATAEEIAEKEPFYASEEIIYRNIEGIEDVPQTAWITVKDPETGKKVKRLLPLEKVNFFNEHGEDEKGGKKTTDCKAVYTGLIARENMVAMTDLDEKFEGSSVKLSAIEIGSRKNGSVIGSVIGWSILAVFGITILIGLIWILRKKDGAEGFYLMIRKKRRILGIFFLAGAALGAVYTGKSLKAYKAAATSYENIRKEAQIHSDEAESPDTKSRDVKNSDTESSRAAINEERLREINPDYSFWIRIPGTSIDYPVVWGKEEAQYLDHGFNGEIQKGGAIFADSKRIPFVSANTIIYGHNMKDGSMFSELKKYKDPDFIKEHPCIEIYRHGKWISCPVMVSRIIEENDVTPYQNGKEKILTLSTCYGSSKRMIVQAKLSEQ